MACCILSFPSRILSGPGSAPVNGNRDTISASDTVSPTITGTSQFILVSPPATTTHFAVSAPTSVTAGSSFLVQVTALDQHNNPAFSDYTGTVHFTSSDGSASLPSDITLAGGTGTFSATFNNPGAQTISATDTASPGITGASNVILVSPAVTQFAVSTPTNVTAGSPFLVTVIAQDDSGRTALGYSGTVTWSSTDSRAVLPPDATLTNGVGAFVVTLKTVNGAPWTISARDTLAAAITGSSGKIAVTPAPASYFRILNPGTVTTGTPTTFVVFAMDPYGNVASGYSGQVRITSSDGNARLPADATLSSGEGFIGGTLNTAGSQTVTVTDTMATNPTITGTSSAVTTRGLVVTAFTPNDSGFSATFSKPFNAADLTLYGSGPSAVQDVTLVGKTSGPIAGTLIVNATDTGITFVASENSLQAFFGTTILPDDTYTATLVSGSGGNGFLDALNAGLDGLDSGGHANYTSTFTIANSGKPALSIPDFARGPDGAHAIKVPNDTVGGIPITLANAAGVTNVTFVLNYNPALLTPAAGSTVDSTAAATATFTMTTVDASDVMFTYTNTIAQSGTVVLGDIVATVPNSAASLYKDKELLNIGSAITINGTALTSATGAWANGVHVNAYFGDVTGNGTIDGLDVATANNVAQGKATGFASFSLLDPAILGDVADDISVDAGDVSTLASFVSKLPTPQIPAIPTGLTIVPQGADPTLSLGEPGGVSPRSLPAASGIVNVQVLLDHPHPDGSTGMDEAILALAYDPKALSVSSADITLGSMPGLGAGWQLSSVIDQATGQIGIELFSTTAITATQAGSLVNVAFHVLPRLSVLPTAVQLVNSVMLSGQQVTTQVDDAQGQYVLSPPMDRLVVPTGLGPVATILPVRTGSADTAANGVAT